MPRFDKKEKRRKNKEGTPSSSIRRYLSVLILSSAENITHQGTIRQGHFLICWFWAHQLFRHCRYCRKNWRKPSFSSLIINAQNLNFPLPYWYKQRGLRLLFSGVYLTGATGVVTKLHVMGEGLHTKCLQGIQKESVQVLACVLRSTQEDKEDG